MSEWRYELLSRAERDADHAFLYRGEDMVAVMLARHARNICKKMNGSSAGLSPSQAPATGKADTGLPVNSPKE